MLVQAKLVPAPMSTIYGVSYSYISALLYNVMAIVAVAAAAGRSSKLAKVFGYAIFTAAVVAAIASALAYIAFLSIKLHAFLPLPAISIAIILIFFTCMTYAIPIAGTAEKKPIPAAIASVRLLFSLVGFGVFLLTNFVLIAGGNCFSEVLKAVLPQNIAASAFKVVMALINSGMCIFIAHVVWSRLNSKMVKQKRH